MKSKMTLPIVAALSSVLLLVGAVSAEATIKGSPGAGSFVHQTDGTAGNVYRYGPSIIMNTDGTGDAWFCAPSYTGPWDEIAHKQTTDFGVTWSNDTIVLQSTAGSRDALSVCDPGVFKVGEYYYMGYTSTEDNRGTDNDVYVARSTSPVGPFQKWNGSGWGGNPQPFIEHTGAADTYGAGEPSFVVKGSKIYVYYTWWSRAEDGSPINQTRVATARVSDKNWPGALKDQGVAIDKTAFASSDSADVKYIDEYGKFIAVTTARRFGPSAYLQFWESKDGLSFVPSNISTGHDRPFLHNAGLSGDATGHINVDSPHNFVAYAFGPQWANWDTYQNPITYTNDKSPAPPRIQQTTPKNGEVTVSFTPDASVDSWTLNYGTSSGNYTGSIPLTSTSGTVTGLTNGVRYYFSVTATKGSRLSDNSEEVFATPENYQAIPIVDSSASSSLAGHSVSASYDGDANTFYSSVGHASASAVEWVSYDLGSVQTIGRITVSPRSPTPLGSPQVGRHMLVQVSDDGSTWSSINYLDANSNGMIREPLTDPVAARYVRIHVDYLGADESNNRYLQIGEVLVESVPMTAFSSSVTPGWEPHSVIDGDMTGAFRAFSSVLHANSTGSEIVALDLGTDRSVTGVLLSPRAAGAGFPVNFTLQSSSDSTVWTDIPGQSYTGFANPGDTPVALRFDSPVSTRYLRLVATELGGDGSGNYALQLAQWKPLYQQNITASASSVSVGFPASNAVDGNPATFYSSLPHDGAGSPESVTVDLGAVTAVSRLRLIPRQGYSFPAALTVQYSSDNVNWTTVPGQTYEKFFNPAEATTSDNIAAHPLFDFRTVVSARYFRISATTLRQDNGASYYFQLADIQVNP